MGLRRSRRVYSQIYSGRSLSLTYRMNEHHAPNVCITCAVHTDFFILKSKKKGGRYFVPILVVSINTLSVMIVRVDMFLHPDA